MKRSLGTLHAFYSLKSLFKLSSHAILKPLCGHVKEFPLYYELIFYKMYLWFSEVCIEINLKHTTAL